MTFQIGLLIALVAIVIIAFLLRKQPWFEKYWKYSLVLLPAIVLLVLIIMKKKTGDPKEDQQFAQKIQEVKQDMQEVSTVAQAKTEMVKADQQEKLTKLNEIVQISDKDKRRAQLAALINNQG